jgi:hypothetical protein
MTKRAKAGDVLGVSTPDGVICLQYLRKHAEYGDAVTVCTVKQTEPVTISTVLFGGGYVAFYPATAALARGMAKIIGHLPPPGLPSRLRRPGVRLGRDVKTWVIEEPTRDVVRERLSEEERLLPIGVIWNHELLIQRVGEGWRPEMEGSK